MKKLCRHVSYILYFILILSVNSIQAQSPSDEITVLLENLSSQKDSTEVNTLLTISWKYRNIDADSALYYSDLAFQISKSINYQKGVSQSLNYIGVAYRNKSNFPIAMSYYFKALKIAEESNDVKQICYTLLNIGNIYVIQGDYEGGLEHFERALKMSANIDDQNLSGYCHVNLGRALTGIKEFRKADQHFNKAKKVRSKNGDLEGIIFLNIDLADLYMAMNQPDKALTLLEENFDKIKSVGQNNILAYNYLSTAQALRMKNDFDESLANTELALEVSSSHDIKNAEIRALKNKAEILDIQGRSKDALETYKEYIMVKDSVFSEKSVRQIANSYSDYTFEKSESEKKSQQAQIALDQTIIHRQQTVIILAAIAAVLCFVLAVMAYRSYAEKNKLNAQIKTQKENAYKHNAKLIDINNEKNNLIRILSHDLRSPINNIKGLTSILQLDSSGRFNESEENTLTLIKNESDRLLTMISKILNVESLDNEEEQVKMEKICVNSIADEVVSNYKKTAARKDITLIADIAHQDMHILGDQIHLHQVVENLLSNAIKFSNRHKQIEVKVRHHNNKVRLGIKDQGPGLTHEDKQKIFKKFQTLSAKPTGDEESTGLGLSIVKKYVEEMKGQIWHESKLGKGTEFIVEFDLINSETLQEA